MISAIYNAVLYQPLLNFLVFIYDTIPDIGVAIILVTIVIRLALYPLSRQSIKAQKSLQEIQPKIEKIKKEFPDQEEQARKMLELYKEEKVNPFSSCLPLLIQLPIFIAVYHVFRNGLSLENVDLLYSFVKAPGVIEPTLLGILDLSKPSYVLAILTGIIQFWQTRMLTTKQPPAQVRGKDGTQDESMAAMMNKQMQFMLPAITIFIGVTLPAGLTLYWFVTTIFTVVQQYLTLGFKKKDADVVDTEIVKE